MSMLKVVILFTTLLHSFIEAEVVFNASSTANDDWWKYASYYQIYPRTFQDSDGDGMGDLKGITSKLQHLVNAGVTATWLSPIFKSPGVDGGYDISDFREIDENLGTMSDFEELLKTAHELGIKVILDFVPNHTSKEHDWFLLSSNKTAGYEDYYMWRSGYNSSVPPNNWLSEFKYSAWEYVDERGQFYFHQFTTAQPDLNLRNSAVLKELEDILTFWLDKGVDGFRVDAVLFFYEDAEFRDEPLVDNYEDYEVYDYKRLDHIYTKNQPENYELVYQWRELIDNYNTKNGGDTRVIMTEAYANINVVIPFYGNDTYDGAHFAFNFFLISNLTNSSTADEIVTLIKVWFENMPSRYVANWVLGNHDKPRIATHYGVENSDGYNMLKALLPGIVVTYYGEEIGMENGEVSWEDGQDPSACNGLESNWQSSSRDFQRTPMQWDSTFNAGFSTANKTWLPVSSKYLTNNLALQSVDGVKSHFHIYQSLVELRKENTLIYGNLNIEVLDTYVLAFTRELAGNATYAFIFNVGDESATVSLSSFTSITGNLTVVLSNLNSTKQEGDILLPGSISIDAHEAILAKSE